MRKLRKEFELLNMKEGEKVDSFLAVVNKIMINGEVVQPSTVVSKILSLRVFQSHDWKQMMVLRARGRLSANGEA